MPSFSQIDDFSVVTSCLVLPGFLLDVLLVSYHWGKNCFHYFFFLKDVLTCLLKIPQKPRVHHPEKDYVSFRSYDKPLKNVDHLTLDVPLSRTEAFQNFVFVRVCRQWNELPLNIRESNTLSVFRKNLMTFCYDKFNANFYCDYFCGYIIILFLFYFISFAIKKTKRRSRKGS